MKGYRHWILVSIGALVLFGFLVVERLADPPVLTNVDTARRLLRDVHKGLDLFETDCGRYPTEKEGLNALIVDPLTKGWHGPYLKHSTIPCDPWGTPLRYMATNEMYYVICAGADRKFDTADDLTK
jgi:general secretion pathway protein G